MIMDKQITVILITTFLVVSIQFYIHVHHTPSLPATHRLWILEREGTVLSTPPTVKGNPSTDLEILLFVSQKDFYFLCVYVFVCVCVCV